MMKISILTPSYNADKYLHRAITSVMKQGYTNWEHIVSDGGSSDGTVEILESYPHLIWESASDSGQCDAMNKAFQKSTGDIIVYLNADDEFNEGWFQEVIRTFQSNEGADMVVANLTINNMGRTRLRKPSVLLTKILDYWPCKFPLNPVAYAYKRTLQEKIGPFPLDNHFTMDYWFLLRAYLFGRVVKTEFDAGVFYIDGANKSSDIERAKASLRKVRNDFIREFFFTGPVMKFLAISVPILMLKKIKRRLKDAIQG